MIPIITVLCPICQAVVDCDCSLADDGSLVIDTATPLAAHIASAHPASQENQP